MQPREGSLASERSRLAPVHNPGMSASASQTGPDIVRIAALIGERARAQALVALMSGRALTATELASVAGVTKATMSAHLAKLRAARLVCVTAQGRHRYFRLVSADVAHLIENLMGVAFRAHADVQVGPSDPALRKARVCYDHLAGELGVLVYERLTRNGALQLAEGELQLSETGVELFTQLGVDVEGLRRGRRVLCRSCLDWSERRTHLAGALGAALLQRVVALRWARVRPGQRIVRFTPTGERALKRALA
jgi:DNA-binding transcriptional ArsR family regulator